MQDSGLSDSLEFSLECAILNVKSQLGIIYLNTNISLTLVSSLHTNTGLDLDRQNTGFVWAVAPASVSKANPLTCCLEKCIDQKAKHGKQVAHTVDAKL